MLMKSRVPLQPRQHFRVLVRGVVVHNQMQVQLRRRLGVDLFQELDPLLMPVPRQAVGDDFPFGQFDRGEQRGGPVAFVVVRHRLQPTGEQWQAFLRAVQRLNLALLITRENQRMLRRIEIQPDDVDQFLREPRIVRDFEALGPVRLEAVVAPDALHQRVIAAQRLGQCSRRPLRGVRRRLLRGLADDLRLETRPLRRGAAATRRIVFDPWQPVCHKPSSPRPDGAPRATEFGRDVLVLAPVGRRENDSSPLHQPRRGASSARPLGQRDSLFVRQNDRFRNAHGTDPPGFGVQTPAITISSRNYAALH